MGTAVCHAVNDDPELELVAAVDPHYSGIDICEVTGISGCNFEVSSDVASFVQDEVEVAIDFTHPGAARVNLDFCAANGIHDVIGTSGFTEHDFASIGELFTSSNCLIAPNFAIGAVLMMRFAEMAAPYFETAEIIELHHDRKVDAPSGTALSTVERMAAASEEAMRERAIRLLEVGHGMRPRVQYDGVVVAGKRKDVVGKLARTVRDAQGLGQLGKLRRVEVAAVDVGDGPGALVLSADISDRRNTAMAGGAVVSAVGGVVVAGAAVAFSPFIVLAAPVVLGAGVVTSRVVHGAAQREIEEHLHEAADSLVSGKEPDGMISRSAKKALQSIIWQRRGRRRR